MKKSLIGFMVGYLHYIAWAILSDYTHSKWIDLAGVMAAIFLLISTTTFLMSYIMYLDKNR